MMSKAKQMKEQALNSSVLIVDDQAANVELLELMLEIAGYKNVFSTTDPRKVVDLYREHRFDLILLDIRMPRLDGFQVMELLDAETGDDYLPVLVLTAQKDRETRLRALERGANDYITKPFDSAEVLTRIDNMLHVRLLYKERLRQNMTLEQRVQERTAQLKETQLDIVRRLGRAGEYRDNETGLHVIRMSKYCQLLGQAAGLEEHFCELILHASPMHDVGKIGIPDRILLKPGRLDEVELEVMQQHTTIGGDILGEDDSEIMSMARDIALSHHEKWDGSGYPLGLAGEDIPISGRICAIADVFDALTSPRVYKPAWSIQDTQNFINEGSGTHFDPDLIWHFNQIIDEIAKIRADYADSGEFRD